MSVPPRLRCSIGGEWKPLAEYSARQIHKLRERARNGERIDGAFAGITCREHYTTEELLECDRCRRTLPISHYSKSSRKRDDPECRQCIAWVEIQEYDVEPGPLAMGDETANERSTREIEASAPYSRVVDCGISPATNALATIGRFDAEMATSETIANEIAILTQQASNGRPTATQQLPSHLQKKATEKPAQLLSHLQPASSNATPSLPYHLLSKSTNQKPSQGDKNRPTVPPYVQASVADLSSVTSSSKAMSYSSSAWRGMGKNRIASPHSTETRSNAAPSVASGSDATGSTLEMENEWQPAGKKRKCRGAASIQSVDTTASTFNNDDLLGDWTYTPGYADKNPKNKHKFR